MSNAGLPPPQREVARRAGGGFRSDAAAAPPLQRKPPHPLRGSLPLRGSKSLVVAVLAALRRAARPARATHAVSMHAHAAMAAAPAHWMHGVERLLLGRAELTVEALDGRGPALELRLVLGHSGAHAI